MFGHYLITALRHFRHAPYVKALNIVSLALGFGCFIIGHGVIAQWHASDRHFANADRIYAITQKVEPHGSSKAAASVSTAYHAAKYLRADFPELEAVARAVNGAEIPVSTGDATVSLTLAGADAQFLDIFDLPFSAGNKLDVLKNPRSLILTSESAHRLFGSTDVLGKRVRLNGSLEVTVTGVSDAKQPSHIGKKGVIRYDMLASWDVMETLIASAEPAVSGTNPEIWVAKCCTTYALLPKDGSFTPRDLRTRLQAFAAHHVPKDQLAIADVKFDAIPVSDIGTADLQNVLLANSGLSLSVETVVIAFMMLVLAVACLNYANLSAAQTLARSSEFSVRKVLGASQRQLAVQHWLEVGLLVVLSALTAMALALLSLPVLHTWSGVDIDVAIFATPAFIATMLVLVIVVTCMVSFYPSLVAAKVRPRAVLHGKRAGTTRGGLKFLIGIQFTAGCLLFVTVLVIAQQNRELRNIGLSNDMDQFVAITSNIRPAGVDLNTLRAELLRHPEIEAVSSIEITPWRNEVSGATLSRSAEIGSKQVLIFGDTISDGFFHTMQIKMLAGRDFAATPRNPNTDNAPSGAVPEIIISRSSAEQLDFGSPQIAVGQLVYLPNAFGRPPQPFRIIGVVDDKPLHFIGNGSTANAYIFSMQSGRPLVRISGGSIDSGVTAIDAAWHKLAPNVPIQRHFLDELFDVNFEVFAHVSRVFSIITTLALIIATLGLVGMAMHVINSRTHEIGVRKVLGASARRILSMLLREFGTPIVIANVVAWPLAIVASKAYLTIFIHQTKLTAAPFAIGLMFTLFLVSLAVGTSAMRAARLSPSTVLRYE